MEPKLFEEYVKDGTLRIEWRDFPYQGQESVDAALAARAAQAQGKFWEYHDLLYNNQSSGNSGGYSEGNLISLAEEAGLDRRRFEGDLEEGQGLGISGTPTFFINDQVLVGLQPLEVFEKAIEDAHREAEGG